MKQTDLDRATTDDEACPPEWADILTKVNSEIALIKADIKAEITRYVDEPDVRLALRRRDQITQSIKSRIDKINSSIRRLNLIAPVARIQRSPIDGEDLLKQLYRTRRNA